MRGSRIREKLGSGGVVLNVMMPFHSPNLVEILGGCGVDMVLMDCEHGSMSESQCEEMIRAGDAVDLPVIARVIRNDPPTILRILDAGASGVMPPHVTTVDDARRAVQASKYGPVGSRSYGGPRAALRFASATEYVTAANRETLVIGLFEDVAGIDQIDELFAVEGLDALVVGPNDLSFSMGLPAQPQHPDVEKIVDRVITASRRAGKATGLPAGDIALAQKHVQRGCQIISVGAGALLGGAARGMVGALAR